MAHPCASGGTGSPRAFPYSRGRAGRSRDGTCGISTAGVCRGEARTIAATPEAERRGSHGPAHHRGCGRLRGESADRGPGGRQGCAPRGDAARGARVAGVRVAGRALRTRRLPHRPGAAVGTTSHRRPRGHRGPARPGARSRSGGHHRGRARGAGPRTSRCGAQGRGARPGLGRPGVCRRAAARCGRPRGHRADGRSGDRGARRPRRSVRVPDAEPSRRRGPRRTGGLGGGRVAFRAAARRGVPVEAERARHRPAHGGSGRLRSTGEAARAHRKEAGEAQETGLRGPADAHPDVEVLRRTVGGQARSVLLATSAGAALLVVGARHPHGRFGLHVGRVPHAAPHHAPFPVAGVPEEETP
ncbi:universal stress protein [Streptomyces luteogriseus]|uniref:universal stress protein n=1 Tax=Streptomyces luteogriseus TaxID=68233 RepID=UPI003817DE83